LVEIADLDGDFTLRAGDRTEVPDMAVAADPDRRPFRKGSPIRFLQPLIEPRGASAHVSVGGGRHFAMTLLGKKRQALIRCARDIVLHVPIDHGNRKRNNPFDVEMINVPIFVIWRGLMGRHHLPVLRHRVQRRGQPFVQRHAV
jgi:hypothetical protein